MSRLPQARLLRPALLAAAATLALTAALPVAPAQAQEYADVTATTAPPPLVAYDQPPLPGPGYLWTPGYWGWGSYGYYWIPGTWVLPPQAGFLWTPPWWGFVGGRYLFHGGYWGPTIGFYGGINYGFGYFGAGFVGGYWAGGHLFYNSAYNHFGGVHITNVYTRNVTNITVNRVSFNGPGGIQRSATPQELAAERGPRVPPTAVQTQHISMARNDTQLRASVNHGQPPIKATARPTEFRPQAATGAHAGPMQPHAAEPPHTGLAPRPPSYGPRPAEPYGAAHPGPSGMGRAPVPYGRLPGAAPLGGPMHGPGAPHGPGGPVHPPEPHPAPHEGGPR